MNSGCPNDTGRNKNTLRFTFVDYLDSVDTTLSKLENGGHVPGAKCCCPECEALKILEDRFMLKLAVFTQRG